MPASTSENSSGFFGFLRNLFHKWSGSFLTNAENEANAFNAAEAQKQRDWQENLSNTAYQRQVSDMHAAGINPMMAVSSGSGASVPSGAAASSVSPGSGGLDLGSVLQFVLGLKSFGLSRALTMQQIDNLKAQERNTNADTDKKVSETKGNEISNSFAEQTFAARKESFSLQNDLTRSKRKELYKQIDLMDSEITRNIEQAHSEQEKQSLYVQQAVLASREAENIVLMRPYEQLYKSAQTEYEKAAAKAALVSAAYSQGLLDNHVIEKSIEVSDANISVDQARAELDRINGLIAKGDRTALGKELNWFDRSNLWADYVADCLLKLVDSVPVSFVVK